MTWISHIIFHTNTSILHSSSSFFTCNFKVLQDACNHSLRIYDFL